MASFHNDIFPLGHLDDTFVYAVALTHQLPVTALPQERRVPDPILLEIARVLGVPRARLTYQGVIGNGSGTCRSDMLSLTLHHALERLRRWIAYFVRLVADDNSEDLLLAVPVFVPNQIVLMVLYRH